MKKPMGILLSLLLIGALTACGEMPAASESTPTPEPSPAQTAAPADWDTLPSGRYAEALESGSYYFAYKTVVDTIPASGWCAGDGKNTGVSLTLPAGETRELVLDGSDYRIDMPTLLCVRTELTGTAAKGTLTYLSAGEGTVEHPDWEKPAVCRYDTFALDETGEAWQLFYTDDAGALAAIVTITGGESVWLYIVADSFVWEAPEGLLALPENLVYTVSEDAA